MADLPALTREMSDVTFVKLAREIAMGINPMGVILENNKISQDDWEVIQKHPRFLQYLETESSVWGSALNTQERVKLKSAALLEEWLPELYTRMNDPGENLNAKIEAGKLVSRLAGLGVGGTQITDATERFSVTINLGADSQLKFEKDISPRVIDGEATEV